MSKLEMKKCVINRVTTKLDKSGDVVLKTVIDFNLTRSGDLSAVADLVALQDQNVTLAITPEQLELDLTGTNDQ